MKVGRAAGVDDGFFERGKDRVAPLVATIMKSGVVEAFRFNWVEVDGTDATERVLELLGVYQEQLGVLFTDGTIFGGSNVVDLYSLHKELRAPVIAVSGDVPDEEKVVSSLLRYGGEEAVKRYRENPPLEPLETRRGTLYVASVGVSLGEARRAIEAYQLSSKIPEPLRISHLIGREVGRWV